MPVCDDGKTVKATVLMLVLNDARHDSRVRREASALAAAGYAVCVIATHPPGSALPDDMEIDGWRLHRFRYPAGAQWLRRLPVLTPLRHVWQAAALIASLRRQRADIWHGHDFPALALISLARWLKRDPGTLVYDIHDLYFFRAHPGSRLRRMPQMIGRHVEKILARRADLRLTVSPGLAAFTADRWQVPPPVVILNGAQRIDAPALPRPVGARWWLVHTGRMTNKGRCLETMLTVLAETPDDVHLSFIGDGLQQPALEALSNRLGISARVHFVPPVPPAHVPAAIRDADAAVVAFDAALPNYAMALPNKLFEALAAGLPVLALATPALIAFFAEHPVGILWTVDDSPTFAEAIDALRDEQTRRRWQDAAHTAQLALGWDHQAQRLVETYQTLPNRRFNGNRTTQ